MIIVTTPLVEVVVGALWKGKPVAGQLMLAPIRWWVWLYNGPGTVLAYVRSSYE